MKKMKAKTRYKRGDICKVIEISDRDYYYKRRNIVGHNVRLGDATKRVDIWYNGWAFDTKTKERYFFFQVKYRLVRRGKPK